MKLIVAVAALALAGAPSPALADWTPRQVRIIEAANEVLEANAQAFMNSCKIANGKSRYVALTERLRSHFPSLEKGAQPLCRL